MDATVFNYDEAGYQQWLLDHPVGYVLNSYRKPRAGYLPLHTASCHTIREYRQFAGTPAFTGGNYIKVCADTPAALLEWVVRAGAMNFTVCCSSCKPDISSLDEAEADRNRLDRQAQELITSGTPLAPLLPTAATEPRYYYARTKVFNRNPAVVAAALLRANGKCDGCLQEAPFLKAGDGAPYLEVHHKVPLAQRGNDHLDNAEALCPNCHRRKHFG